MSFINTEAEEADKISVDLVNCANTKGKVPRSHSPCSAFEMILDIMERNTGKGMIARSIGSLTAKQGTGIILDIQRHKLYSYQNEYKPSSMLIIRIV